MRQGFWIALALVKASPRILWAFTRGVLEALPEFLSQVWIMAWDLVTGYVRIVSIDVDGNITEHRVKRVKFK